MARDKMPKKLAETLPAHVSITFRAVIDGDLARYFPPDDPQCLAQNIGDIFRHALLSRLEYAMDLTVRGAKAKTDDEKLLHAARVEANEADIKMLKRFMDDQNNPVFTRVRTHNGKVWPSPEKIRKYLEANRMFRKHKEAEAKAKVAKKHRD